ncbi:MAG TPA: hypothetical protein PK747_02105, partial [Acidobacteriota bacterium]|nr:hypothetical protein [Acidobacteriota bacterium]HQQ46186.1 hypothetical protein [Acidobacteriota bacterium]
VTVIGPAGSAGSNVNIQLVWGGSVGYRGTQYLNHVKDYKKSFLPCLPLHGFRSSALICHQPSA